MFVLKQNCVLFQYRMWSLCTNFFSLKSIFVSTSQKVYPPQQAIFRSACHSVLNHPIWFSIHNSPLSASRVLNRWYLWVVARFVFYGFLIHSNPLVPHIYGRTLDERTLDKSWVGLELCLIFLRPSGGFNAARRPSLRFTIIQLEFPLTISMSSV